jgi:uncharacterized protein
LIARLLAWRTPLLGLVAVASALSLWAALGLRVDPGVEALIPSGPGDLDRLRQLHALFGSDEVVVVAFHAEHGFSDTSLAHLDRLTRQIAALPHVTAVLSPTNVRDLEGDELGPAPVVPYTVVQAGRLPPERFVQRLATHPLFGGLLVARDARTAAILAELEPVDRALDYRRDLVATIRGLAAEPTPGLTAFVAGIPVEKVDVATYVARDQKIFTPLVLLIVAIMTLALYGHVIGMLVPVTAVTLTLLWTLGLYSLAGRALNPVTSLMTPVILVMSLEGTVQLLNQYLAGRARGLPLAAALTEAHRRMWLPCLNAALTAAIGFLALLTLPIPAIRDFGLFTAAGLLLGYGLTITLTPLLLASLPDCPARVIGRFTEGPTERGLVRLVRWVCHHRGITALTAGVLLAAAVVGLTRIRIETDLVHSLRHASPLAAATRFIDARMTGVNAIELLLPGVSPSDPDGLARVARFEAAVRALPGVRTVLGLPDLLARVNRAMHRGDDAYARLPEGPDAVADLDDFVGALAKESPADLHRFLARGRDGSSTLRVIARVTALDTASSQALFAQIRDAAGRLGLPRVELTGNFVVFSDMSTTLVRHQARGLGVALILILVVMALQFRSLRLGLLCAIPNGAPVLMVYGLMGWTGVALSVPTAMIASVAIGTIVDNSIYLLARFREAFARQPDYTEALAAMVRASGRAVVFSTVALAGGFWVGVFSSFLPTVHFGLLTGAAFLLGLLSQFILLPLSLVLLRPLGPDAGARPRAGARVATAAFLMVWLVAGPAEAQEAGGAPLLKDQFGRVDGPARYRGQVLLLLYGKVEGLRRMKAWEEQLLKAAPGRLVVVRGLDARAARGQRTEAEVNERLQQNVPREIAILVDWDGALPRAYGLPDAEVSVTILDRQGQVCQTVAGSVTPEGLERARDLLAQVREHGACP